MKQKFSPYKFFNDGYNILQTPKPFYDVAKEFLANSTFVGKDLKIHTDLLPDDIPDEGYHTEVWRERMLRHSAPTELKNLANVFLESDIAKSLKQSLANTDNKNHIWVKDIQPVSYFCFDGVESAAPDDEDESALVWHTDVRDSADFFCLFYFNSHDNWDPQWGGNILFGKEQEDGRVNKHAAHFPEDGTFVMINNTNPYFKHKVRPTIHHTLERKVISIYFRTI